MSADLPALPDADAPWWRVALDPAQRATPDAARLTGPDGRPLVNAPADGDRLGLDYDRYLGLDQLLGAGTPASNVPDERAFVTVHQLCEVAFKQMVFDLAVVAGTLEALTADPDDARFRARALEALPDHDGPDPFWRPALTAAARLRHAARRVLPAVMPYVGRGEDDDVLFSTLEFALFRDALTPSSGFQTAQLRLIQRALGKGPLLDVPVFPGDGYGHHYAGCPVGRVAPGDPLVLQAGHRRAFPDASAPDATAARLDEAAHAALARLAPLADGLPDPPAVARIHADDLARATARFRATLGPDAPDADAAPFRDALQAAAAHENARREGLGDARRGAQALFGPARRTCLAFVLDRLHATDAALHAPDAHSFLTVHRRTVRRHVADGGGTGGGGMPYLVTSQRFLLPLFPALVAYTDLDDFPAQRAGAF